MDKVLARGKEVFLGRPISKFAKVEKVISESMVEVSYYTDDAYTERETVMVSMDLVRTLDNVGYKEEKNSTVKKKRVTYNGKGKQAFNKTEVTNVFNDLGLGDE